MKFRVDVVKMEYVAEMGIEAENKAEAAEKVQKLLDDGMYMVAVREEEEKPVVAVFKGTEKIIRSYPNYKWAPDRPSRGFGGS